MKLGDYLTAINYSKEPLMDTEDESVEKGYVPFVVNRCLSYFVDTIMHANEMNLYPDTPKSYQFDYLQKSIRKRKRFSKWLKKENPERLVKIKELFGYSDRRALEVLELLSDTDMEYVDRMTNKGG
jgi:hypothetical protein